MKNVLKQPWLCRSTGAQCSPSLFSFSLSELALRATLAISQLRMNLYLIALDTPCCLLILTPRGVVLPRFLVDPSPSTGPKVFRQSNIGAVMGQVW